MIMYSESECSTRDIDWFVKIGDIYIHGASNGGILPSMITKGQNRHIQQIVAQMDYLYEDSENEIYINKGYVEQRLGMAKDVAYPEAHYNVESVFDKISPYNAYIASFKDMARKGFYSFDREVAPTFDKDAQRKFQKRYVLIACPKRLQNNRLPNIDNIPEIKYKANMVCDYLKNSHKQNMSIGLVNLLWDRNCKEID